MAKIENKPASAYDQNGTSVAAGMSAVVKKGNGVDELRMSVGNISKNNDRPTKTDGIKIRGTGAATKGVMARGPMA
jgi:hypothetical protein